MDEEQKVNAYAELTRHFGRIARLNDAVAVLQWDTASMMPRGGAEARAEQVSTLRVMIHDLEVDPRIGDWLAEAGEAALDDWQRANLREMRRAYGHATALPGSLVEALSKATAACEMRWRTARGANDFAGLAPYLGEVFRLVREDAAARSAALGLPAYEALLDVYEPGITTARLDALFGELAGFLPDLVERAIEVQAKRAPVVRPEGPFPIEKQRALGLRVMETLGFDFEHGRLDVSTHPFCGGVADDVRITTRYSEGGFLQSLMGIIHETGHALYEQGRPAEWRYQPVGLARSMGVHESQSLLMEMQAARSRAFLGYLAPRLRETFGDSPAWEPENLYRLCTRVERGLIRVDADEVTYPAHVIMRYRLERALIEGQLEVADLPGAWRAGMRELLGVEPPDDKDGCLQDIHWPEGIVGYFPSYTLGAMTAAQLFDAATRAEADLVPGIARGDFRPLLGWLRENVHGQASRWSTDELLVRATGRPLDVGVLRRHLESRYLKN